MKVLFVATVRSHIGQFHMPFIRELVRRGCRVEAAFKDNSADKPGLDLSGIARTYEVPFSRSPYSVDNLKAYQVLKKIIDEGSYDVIHCNTPVGGVLGRLAARKARKHGTKVFYTAHGFHFYKGAPKKNWLIWYPVEKFMCRYTDKLITITQEDYDLASAKFPTQVERIHGVGANSAKYRKLSEAECLELRHELGYADDDKLLLCTGELLPNKNQITAIRVMKALIDQQPKAKLLLAGNGPTLPEFQAEAAALGLQNYVEFLGYRTDLERYANIADVIVSCSYREGLPMNIVEGMLLSKPVAASYNRGHRELIVPDVTGYMVPPADVDAFAEKILLLLNDPVLADRMGHAGYEKARKYTDKSVGVELKAIYF